MEVKDHEFEDGAKFTGQMLDGKMQGQGVLTTKDGRSLEGNFKDD